MSRKQLFCDSNLEMLTLLVFYITMLTMCCGASPQPENMKEFSDSNTMAMAYVGNVDGKSFFVDNDYIETWANVKSYCQTANMQMASFTSAAQVDLIKSKVGSILNTDYAFWTSGTESDTMDRFAWTTSSSSIDPEFIFLYGNPLKTYCIGFWSSNSSIPAYFKTWNCSNKYAAMCEIS